MSREGRECSSRGVECEVEAGLVGAETARQVCGCLEQGCADGEGRSWAAVDGAMEGRGAEWDLRVVVL